MPRAAGIEKGKARMLSETEKKRTARLGRLIVDMIRPRQMIVSHIISSDDFSTSKHGFEIILVFVLWIQNIQHNLLCLGAHGCGWKFDVILHVSTKNYSEYRWMKPVENAFERRLSPLGGNYAPADVQTPNLISFAVLPLTK
jgi:hypothetical protein